MIPDKEYRDFDAYIKDILPKHRKEKFEAKLGSDEEFKIRFNKQKPIIETLLGISEENRIQNIIKFNQIGQIKEGLLELSETSNLQDENGEKLTTFRSVFKNLLKIKPVYFAAAASFLVVCGIFWNDYKISKTYGDYYKPLSGPSAGEQNEPCPNQDILEIYYSGVNPTLFLEKISNSPESDCKAFYKGLALLELQKPKEAIEELKKGINSNDFSIKNNAEWYLALAYYKNNQLVDSRKLLSKISMDSEENIYAIPAKELLLKINRKPILFNFQK